MLLHRAKLVAATAGAVLASGATASTSAASGTDSRNEPLRPPGGGRRLSEEAVSRRMARAHRILDAAEPNSTIHEVSIDDFFLLLASDADAEFGHVEDMTPEEKAAVTKRWEEYAMWDYGRAVEAEKSFYANDATVELGDILYAYVVCDKNAGSAFRRKNDMYDSVAASPELNNMGVDVTTEEFKAEYLAALETVYNTPDMTCSFGKFRASTIAIIAGIPGVGVVPMNTAMKVRGGVVDEILSLAFGDTGNSTDIEENNNISAEQSQIDVVACQSVTQDEIDRLGTKVIDFMTRKTADGTSYVAAQSPYANLTDAELEGMPERVRLWRNAFVYGIDSAAGCDGFLAGLKTEVHSQSSGMDDSATIRIQLTDITADAEDENEDYNDVACTLGLIWGLALLPQVCSLEMVQEVETDASEGTGNAESQWITQGGASKGSNQHTRPFWESGIQGENQVVAISDSGIDVNHCYFWDEKNGMAFNAGYDLARRKIIQYIPFVDSNDELAGHGTHVAGTVAGHLSNDGGQTESDGLEDGVARNAKIAFIDCSSGGPGLSIPPTNQLMSTGRDAGAKLHSASWGSHFNNRRYQYDSQARNIDDYTYKNWDMLMVVAAGNYGRDGPKTTISPGIAKNVLAVGAGYTSNNRYGEGFVADFSSEGPTPDGRIAPQIVAPGNIITSSEARPNEVGECEADGALTSKSGTSMATPAVSGAAALVRQYFVDGFYPTGLKSSDNKSIDPSGTLMKAIILNSGQAMDGKIRSGTKVGSVPYDNIQGFGRISLTSTLRLSAHSDVVSRVVDRANVDDGESKTYSVVVNNTICEGRELRATLVWADPPGASGCLSCIISDLDLELTNDQTNVKYYPYGLTTKEYKNNAERIIIPVSTLTAGDSWTAKVTATNLDRASQPFSLVMSGCFNFDGQDMDIGFVKPPGGGASPGPIMSSFLVTAVALLASVCFLV